MTRFEQLAAHFDYSAVRIRAALEQLHERILIAEMSDDRAHTGHNRDQFRQMLSDEVALSGALRRVGDGIAEQMELAI